MARKHHHGYLIIGILFLAVLFVSCGEEHRSRSLVKSFLEENLINNDYSVDRWEKYDSTFRVSSQAIASLHTNVTHIGPFKSGIRYQPYKQGDKLYFIRLKYEVETNGDKPLELTHTFYIDKDWGGIVAVKEN
ncbi:MAG: hypothetical protein IKT00_01280 [Prevotella sp.]|nr:hypothetical protein [Prevotella sp.]